MLVLNEARVSLAKLTFSGVRFSGANLSNVSFLLYISDFIPCCHFSNPLHVQSMLDGAIFDNCDLSGVDLSKAWLANAELKHCNMQGVILGAHPALEVCESFPRNCVFHVAIHFVLDLFFSFSSSTPVW